MNGIILTLLPDEQYTLRRPAVKDPHLTVLYLGNTEAPDFKLKPYEDYWDMIQKVWGHTIRASVTAESAFDGGADGWAMVDLINAPFLPEFYGVASESAQLFGLEDPKIYGLLPHITKRYIKGVSTIEILHRKINIPFTFDRVGLWVGEDHWEMSLT